VNIPPRALAGLRTVDRQAWLLLMFAKCKTGAVETGPLVAYQAFGRHADLMTLAKTLEGASPAAAMLNDRRNRPQLAPECTPHPPHPPTFGGNPIADRAGIAPSK